MTKVPIVSQQSHFEIVQEANPNNDSVTDELLILVSQKFEESQGWYLGNDKNNDTNEILLLASLKFEEKYSIDGQLLQRENLVA